MKYYFMLIAFMLSSIIVNAQTYKTKDILAKADSIMISKVGKDIFEKYYCLDSYSFFAYSKRKGKVKYEYLFKSPLTKGNLKAADVRYSFCLDVYNLPCLNERVKFDGVLNWVEKFNPDYIPKYILKNKPCDFVSDSAALITGTKTFVRKGIKPISLRLDFNHTKKRYIWCLYNTITEGTDFMGKPYGEMEEIQIDAVTGEVLEYTPNMLYGTLY
jgi:hypothetical protein